MKNYHLQMEEELNSLTYVPRLLLHVCCAPCSSYVLSILSHYFKISIIYYNPNITSSLEYNKRLKELKRFLNEVKYENEVDIISCSYNNLEFFDRVKGLEDEPEGGKRCYECYKLRLEHTCLVAKDNNYDYFATSLSISPYKNASWLNEIGLELQNKHNIKYLVADFKKNNGYKTSIDFSKKYNLYRQDFCGCIYSKIARDKRLKLKND